MTARALALGAGVLALLASVATGVADPATPTVANLPAPGSYALARIQRTPAATLVDPQGKDVALAELTRGAVTALGFFYGRCADPTGCPVAWSAFEEARRQAAADELLKSRLRLVFVSLDPDNDTPAALRLLRDAENRETSVIPWAFATARSQAALAPLLAAMGQDISFEIDASGRGSGVINHMLKVFLIDPDGWVREIYSTAFLSPENLLNDARTLALAHPEATNK
jgi:cytochrome oxidase Cu insertion factor (SCO1/SenC/PrrC family)